MSDSPEKLQSELAAARRAVVELHAQLERHEAGHRTANSELGENRSALLFMLEDLEAERNKIDLAHRERVDAMDAVNDPIFLHDKEFRILRCNKAYQQCAGISSMQITGQTSHLPRRSL